MAHHPGPSGMPLVARVLVVPLLRLAWWMPTRWQRGDRHALVMQATSDPSIRAREARAALAAYQAAERRSATGRHTLHRQLRRAARLPSMAAAPWRPASWRRRRPTPSRCSPPAWAHPAPTPGRLAT